jgi:hypothetical protein
MDGTALGESEVKARWPFIPLSSHALTTTPHPPATTHKTQLGDKVLLNEPRCFCNRLNAPARRVIPLPEREGIEIGFEDAASVQVGALCASSTRSFHRTQHDQPTTSS